MYVVRYVTVNVTTKKNMVCSISAYFQQNDIDIGEHYCMNNQPLKAQSDRTILDRAKCGDNMTKVRPVGNA